MNFYFITGTSSGIGKAMVEELVKYDQNKIAGYARRSSIQHEQYCHQTIDLSDIGELKAFRFPELTSANRIVLVNNAGTLGPIKHLGELSSADIIEAVQVNVTAAAVLANEFIKRYQHLNCAKMIVNISSGAATSAYEAWSSYCASKAALNMHTQVIAKEQLGKEFPIDAFAIAPGVVDTYMQTSLRNADDTSFKMKQKFIDLKESGKLYDPSDVVKKLIEFIEQPEKISALISRIEL